MNPKELREKYQAIRNEMKALVSTAEKEGRNLTDKEQKRFDDWKTEAADFINRAERLEEIEREDAAMSNPSNFGGQRNPQNGGGNTDPNQHRNGNENLPGHITVRDAAADDPMRGFRNDREFLTCVMAHCQGRGTDDRLKPLLVSNTAGSDEMQTQSDPYGGVLVPEAMSPDFLTTDPEPDPMLGRLQNVPMDAPVVKIPSRVDKDHSTSVSGGLTVTRREETAAMAASRMEMEKVRLEAFSLFGLAYATEELLNDSPRTMAGLLANGFRDEFTVHMINERLNGTGVGEHLGILNSPALVTVLEEDSQAADTIVAMNVINMRARCWGYQNAIWLSNHDCYPQLSQLSLAVGSAVVMLYHHSAQEDRPDTLLGRPILYTEYTKTLGDKGDLVLFNGTQYLEGTYQPMNQAESVHVRFLNHERAFKFWVRNAGAPWWRSPLTPKNSTNTLSPFVVLEERDGS